MIGHRGEPAKATEETIPSFQAALDDQADVLEFDVRWTRDDAMVALHDATLDRTTDCTGTVTSKTPAQVREFQAAGVLVWLYTVTGPVSNDAAVSRYPDGIITNDTVLTRTGLP